MNEWLRAFQVALYPSLHFAQKDGRLHSLCTALRQGPPETRLFPVMTSLSTPRPHLPNQTQPSRFPFPPSSILANNIFHRTSLPPFFFLLTL
jgi:hypothetical protein